MLTPDFDIRLRPQRILLNLIFQEWTSSDLGTTSKGSKRACPAATTDRGLWFPTEMPNCCRAMRMTSSVLSALPTASVLACREQTERCHNVHVVLTEGKTKRERKKAHIGAVPNILGEDLQGDGLGVVPVFSLQDPTEVKEARQT